LAQLLEDFESKPSEEELRKIQRAAWREKLGLR
jgi:hypothetical protein